MSDTLELYEEAIKSAVEADKETLPEFKEGSVVLADDLTFKDFDDKIQAAAKLSDGFCLIIYGAAGDSVDDYGDSYDVGLKAELFISPALHDSSVNETLRPARTIMLSLVKYLNGESFYNLSGHCHGQTRVKQWVPVTDPDFKVWQLTLECRLDL